MLYVVGGCGCTMCTNYVGETSGDCQSIVTFVTTVTTFKISHFTDIISAFISFKFLRHVLNQIDMARQRWTRSPLFREEGR